MEHETNSSLYGQPFSFVEKDYCLDKFSLSLSSDNWDLYGDLATSSSSSMGQSMQVPNEEFNVPFSSSSSSSFTFNASPKHLGGVFSLTSLDSPNQKPNQPSTNDDASPSLLSDRPWYHQNVNLDELLQDPEILQLEKPLPTPLFTDELAITPKENDENAIETLSLTTVSIPEQEEVDENQTSRGKKGKKNGATATETKKETSKKSTTNTSTTIASANKKSEKKPIKEKADDKKKESQKKKTVSTVTPKRKREVEAEPETDMDMDMDMDMGDFEEEFNRDSSGGPPLTRKEKNCEAARKYRKRLREEAQVVSKKCEDLSRENATIRGQIDSIKKQIDEYKELLMKLNIAF